MFPQQIPIDDLVALSVPTGQRGHFDYQQTLSRRAAERFALIEAIRQRSQCAQAPFVPWLRRPSWRTVPDRTAI